MIFHITTPETWETAQLINKYESTSLEKEGFIHCSTKSQVINIANTFYSDYEQLIVLEINPDKFLTLILNTILMILKNYLTYTELLT